MKDMIYTLKASEIIKIAQPGTYHGSLYDWREEDVPLRTVFDIDLTRVSLRSRFVKSLEPADESAFLYQVRKLIKGDSLRHNIVIVDFEKMFSKISYTDAHTMVSSDFQQEEYDEGYIQINPYDNYREYTPDKKQTIRDFFVNSKITIRFEDNVEHEFVIFDKSSSMARNSRIFLVNIELLGKTGAKIFRKSLPNEEKNCDSYLKNLAISYSEAAYNELFPDSPEFVEDPVLPCLEEISDNINDFNFSWGIVRVELPDKIGKIKDHKKLFSFPRMILFNYDGVEEPDSRKFYPLVESSYCEHVYYLEERLWNAVKGKDNDQKMSFLREKISAKQKNSLLYRLNMGIDFHGIEMSLSKFYSYRGLYLSSSRRIDPKLLDLNEKTIIVLPDKLPDKNMERYSEYCYSATADCFQNKKDISDNKEVKISFEQNMETTLCNDPMFDGEGLICGEYAGLINNALNLRANSFQIRMPFIKGVVHTVDFHGFLKEFSAGDMTVKDIFGIRRDLSKAKIILTESMFKASKWLREIWANDITLSSGKEIEDPMAFFFARMKEYDHALYISNSDASLQKDGFAKINYQILSNLKFTKTELKQLVEDNWKLTENPMEILLPNDSSAKSEKKTDDSPLWIQALRKEPKLQYHPYIKNSLLEKYKNDMKYEFALGRLNLPGENRYLSRDLLLFLKYLIELVYQASPKTNKKLNELLNNINSPINSELLEPDCAYVPKCGKMSLKNGEYYPVFRNPHLSRNEECLLKVILPDEGSIREKYLGELSGVLMVSGRSFVPKTLGGADFDGDYVKIFNYAPVAKAVKRGVYDENFKRKLPIININPLDSTLQYYTDAIDYFTLYHTFAGRVGLISNDAIRDGEIYYAYTNKENLPDGINDPAEYSILAGLEIDACKTGIHPKIPHNKKNELKEGTYLDSFLKPIIDSPYSRRLKRLPAKSSFLIDVVNKKTGISSSFRITKKIKDNITYEIINDDEDNKKPYKISASELEGLYEIICLKTLDPNGEVICVAGKPDGKTISPMDYISYCFLYGCLFDHLPYGRKNRAENKTKENRKYTFELKEDCRPSPELEKKGKKLLEELKNSKSEISDLQSVHNIVEQQNKYQYFIQLILKEQGYTNPDKLIIDYEKELEDCLKCEKKTVKALSTLKNSDWHFLYGNQQKKLLLKKILGTSPLPDLLEGEGSCIFNYYFNGYNLLFLFLQDLLCSFRLNDFISGSPLTSSEITKETAIKLKGLSGKGKKDFFTFIYDICDSGKNSFFWNLQDFTADEVVKYLKDTTDFNP